MSRRRESSVHFAYARVKLLCPHDHVVGSVVRQMWGDGPGETYLVNPDGRTARALSLDGKVTVDCAECAEMGRRGSYQVAARRLAELLAERGKHQLHVC